MGAAVQHTHRQVPSVQEATVPGQRLFTRLAQLAVSAGSPHSAQCSLLLQATSLLSYLSLPKWSAKETQLMWGNSVVQVQPFKKHLRQHRGFYLIKCQGTGDIFPCIPIRGFAVHLPVTLLHYGYFLYDLLQVRFHRNLFNGNNLTRFFMDGFEYTAIRTRKQNIEQVLNIKMQMLWLCILWV